MKKIIGNVFVTIGNGNKVVVYVLFSLCMSLPVISSLEAMYPDVKSLQQMTRDASKGKCGNYLSLLNKLESRMKKQNDSGSMPSPPDDFDQSALLRLLDLLKETGELEENFPHLVNWYSGYNNNSDSGLVVKKKKKKKSVNDDIPSDGLTFSSSSREEAWVEPEQTLEPPKYPSRRPSSMLPSLAQHPSRRPSSMLSSLAVPLQYPVSSGPSSMLPLVPFQQHPSQRPSSMLPAASQYPPPMINEPSSTKLPKLLVPPLPRNKLKNKYGPEFEGLPLDKLQPCLPAYADEYAVKSMFANKPRYRILALVDGEECDLHFINDYFGKNTNADMFEPLNGTPIGLQFHDFSKSSFAPRPIIYRDIDDSRYPSWIRLAAMYEDTGSQKKLEDVQVSNQPTPDINLTNIVRDNIAYSPVVIKKEDNKYYQLVVQTSIGLYRIYVRNGERNATELEADSYSQFIGVSDDSRKIIPVCGFGKKNTTDSLAVVGKMPISFFSSKKLLDHCLRSDPATTNNNPPVGIVNPESLCYLNAGLQLLYNIPLIRYKIMCSKNRGPLHRALARQFAMMLLGEKYTGKPAGPAFEVYNALFPDSLDDINNQVDVLGALRTLYAREMEETEEKADSFVLELIRFATLRTMEADDPNVPWKSVMLDIDSGLMVPFGELEDLSLEKRLAKSFEDKRYKYPCDKYGEQNCTTSVCMAAPPPVLQIFLPRFVQKGKTMDKDCSHCSFPGTINLKKYSLQKNTSKATSEEIELAINNCDLGKSENKTIADRIRGACSQKSTTKYILYGVLVHSGQATGGHYTTYIRNDMLNPDNSKWLYFDDAKKVKTVGWDEMTKYSYGVSDDQVKETCEIIGMGPVTYDRRLMFKSSGSCALALLYIQQDLVKDIYKP